MRRLLLPVSLRHARCERNTRHPSVAERALQKELRQAITTGEPYRPRVMYEMSGNKYAVMGPSLQWKDAFDQQDFVIQQYPNMTSFTIQSVDLFLPTTEWLEYDSYEAPGTHFNRHYARCAVTHLGETVNPFVSPYQVGKSVVEHLARKIASIRMRSNSRSSRAPKPHAPHGPSRWGAAHGMRCYPTSTNAIPKCH